MNKIRLFSLAIAIAFSGINIHAGGLLTNTNQNIAFLRNPARDAAIGIDGIYTNPAGVAFLSEGWHLSINWQWAHQTRTINTAYGPLFSLNTTNPAPISSDGYAYRKFKGVADAPVIPSIQAAYNKGRWSFQGGIAVSGGGGKCEFDNGLGSFEGVVASIAQQLGMTGYSVNNFMRGKQYYFGFSLGAAYKVTDNLAVFGGARMLYGMAKYEGFVDNITLRGPLTMNQDVPATDVFRMLKEQYIAAGDMANAQRMGGLEEVTKGIYLDCDQKGIGIAPFIGVDYKIGKLNLAAKFDFKTRMRLKNTNHDQRFSTIANILVQSGSNTLLKYEDGNKVAEDSPALLTIGAQYEITDKWRIMAGYHHFFDVDTKQYYGSTLGDSQEVNIGTEYDITDKLQVSAGLQKTMYDMEDDFMSDISFNVSSYTFGFGAGIKVSPKVKINAAYFQTNYDTKNVTSNEGIVKNAYTRTNRVFGLGCDIDF